MPSASGAADAASQLLKYAQAQADPLLSSLSQELGAKVASLSQSLSGDPALRGSLTNAVLSVVGGKDTEAMSLVQKLTQAKLTPEQMGLAKQVRDVTSAFLVQKNLASLDGAQTEVGQIVNSLRKGETAAALPAIQKVAMNAKLTPAQKDFVTTLADQYAPGLKSATDALQKGLDGLKSFGK